MDLNKKKYLKSEVEDITSDFNDTILKLKEKNSALQAENEKLKMELSACKTDSALIGRAIITAEKFRDEIQDKLKFQYQTEIDNLKLFIEKYRTYFEYIKEKYPYYPAVKTAQDLVACFDKIIKKHVDDSIKIKVMSRLLDTPEIAMQLDSPKEKIKDYIENESGASIDFDMEQILNPGELDLEALCKDLGLIEENDK